MVKRILIFCWFLSVCLTSNVWCATETVLYAYDENLQIIRTDYDSLSVVDYLYDGAGNRMISTTYASGASTNMPPLLPSAPSPGHSMVGISSTTLLGWSSGDPDIGDVVFYDIYLGTEPSPPLLVAGHASSSYQIDRIYPLTTYYWRIVARDNHNAESSGPIWSFTTTNAPPLTPVALFPALANEISYDNVYLNWQAMDPDLLDAVRYDVYFGSTNDPSLVLSDTTKTSYDLGALNPSTVYYWKIVAKDNYGGITSGPVWSFQTADGEPNEITENITENTTLAAADGPYLIQSSITVEAGVTLTLEPGTIIKVGMGEVVNIEGRLLAQGTDEAPIIITSERDDYHGGDTNADGNLTEPCKGDWSYLSFNNSSDGSQLSFVEIYYGGAGDSHTIQLNDGTTTSISNCILSQSAGRGIYLNSEASAVISNTVFEDNNNYDFYCSGSFEGEITENIFHSNLWITGDTLFTINNNTFNINNDRPIHIHPNKVQELFSDNIIEYNQLSFIEVTNGIISSDAIWPALMPYHILGSITVQGSDGADNLTTLTVAAGAQLRFDYSCGLTIGGPSGAPGALAALGTAENQILFTSNSKTVRSAGDWGGLIFYNTTDDATTQLSYCTIEYAGYGTNNESVYIYNASPTLNNCTVRHSQGYGVHIQNGTPLINGNVFSDCLSHGIYVGSGAATINGNTFADISAYDIYLANANGVTVTNNILNNGLSVANGILAGLTGNNVTYDNTQPLRLNVNNIGAFFTSNTITNIDSDSYIEVVGDTISSDATWPALMPYHILSSITVQGSDGADSLTTLTVAAGAQLRFDNSCNLTVGGYSGAPGALVAVGTAEDPIVFTANQTSPSAGDWAGLIFSNTTDDATTQLAYCTIEYAGYGISGKIVYIYSASPTLRNCILRYSQGYGIYVSNGALQILDNEISHCSNHGIYVASGATTIDSNTFADISANDIYLANANGVTVTNNILGSGLYAATGTFAEVSGNSLIYNSSQPLRLNAENIGAFFTGNTITNIDTDSYIEVTSGTISLDATWPALMPYHILGSITVQGSDGADSLTTLTVAAGAQLRFNNSCNLTVGGNSGAPGALVAVGTAEDPIVFTANKAAPSAGDWTGLIFNNTTDNVTTQLAYCTIEYAGYGTSGEIVYIYSASPTLRNCILRYSQGYGIYVSNGALQILDNEISHCSNHGIYVASGAATIDSNTLADSGGYDLYLNNANGVTVTNNILGSGLYAATGTFVEVSGNSVTYNSSQPLRLNAENIGAFFTGNTITNIDTDSYIEVTSGTISSDATWPALMTYHILGSFTVQGSDGADSLTTLTVAAGAQLRFNSSCNLTVGGYSGAPGALVAVGTAEDPIVFTANKAAPSAGDWTGLIFNNTTDDATTQLAYCTIEYAGYGTSGKIVYIYSASPTLRNCILRYSQGYGIYVINGAPQILDNEISHCSNHGIYVASGAATIDSNTLADSGGYDLYLNNANGVTVTNNILGSGLYAATGTFAEVSGNSVTYNSSQPLRLNAENVGAFFVSNTITNIDTDSYIEVTSGTISSDATWPALMPYHILGSITVQGSDGADSLTTLTMAAGAQLRFNSSCRLTVGGNSGAPGALVAVGTAEDPIVFTANKAAPSAGDWTGLIFNNTTDDVTTQLAYCTIEYAGYGTSGEIVYIYSASPTLRNCIFQYSQGCGIYITNGSPWITNSTISDSNTGIFVASGTPVISNNLIEDNLTYGIYNNNSTTLVAKNNWWGHSSGPYHASSNPGGLGDTVSDRVDYAPWIVDLEDMDLDTIPDDWEIDFFGTTELSDETTDYDMDGLSDSQEYTYDTDPTDWDTDDDGTSDGDEIANGTDPLLP